MYRLTNDDLVVLSEEESRKLFEIVHSKESKDFHYLAFDRQLSGYSPLNVYIHSNNKEVLNDERDIINSLLKRKEVCSLYPKLNLSLYPMTKLNGCDYEIDLDNIDKHFADILKLNDDVYKTKYMWVDFGHGANNFDQELVLKHLRNLLQKSKILEDIYIEFLYQK